MGNKKDIGKAYKEQLEGYTSSPHNRVWENIEAELKKSKRTAFPIWKTITGIGILLLLISSFGIYTYYSNSINNNINTNQTEHITKEDHTENDNNNNNNNNTVELNNNTLENASLVDSNDSDSLINEKANNVIKSNSKTTSIASQHKSAINKKAAQNKDVTSRTSSQNKNATTKNYYSTINNNNLNNFNKRKSNTVNHITTNDNNFRNRFTTNIEVLNTANDSTYLETYPVVIFDVDGLTKLKGEEKKEKKKKPKKEKNYPLTFSAYVTPTYSNAFGKGSNIDALLDNKKTIGGFNINYGIATTVKISDRSSLRLGAAISNISYTTKGADTTHTADNGGFLQNAQGYDNLDLNPEASNMVTSIFEPNSVIDFEQSYKYLEIPVDYIYNLKNDSKFNINLVGGLGALFLLDQSIIAKDRNGNSLEIGKVENLKGTNFSFNLGGNLSYSLSKKLNLDIEPTFKYYLSTFSTNVDSKPYSFGLRLGISYKL